MGICGYVGGICGYLHKNCTSAFSSVAQAVGGRRIQENTRKSYERGAFIIRESHTTGQASFLFAWTWKCTLRAGFKSNEKTLSSLNGGETFLEGTRHRHPSPGSFVPQATCWRGGGGFAAKVMQRVTFWSLFVPSVKASRSTCTFRLSGTCSQQGTCLASLNAKTTPVTPPQTQRRLHPKWPWAWAAPSSPGLSELQASSPC